MISKDIIFITGNQHKADYLAKWLGMPIEHRKVDLDELQSLNLRTVVEHKVLHAYALVKQPVLVEDISLQFVGMGRLPGTLIKWFLEELGNEGLCKMANNLDSREVVATICYGLHDGQNMHFFEAHTEGTIAEQPRGNQGFGWNPIFIPKGSHKTYGEMTEEERQPFSHRAEAVAQLKTFLAQQNS